MIVALADSPDVVAMVPTLGRHDDRLSACLQSVVEQDGDFRVAIVCVANGGDPTAVLPPLATLLKPGLNLGWAGGLTFARSVAVADLLWLIQDDMQLESGCLVALIDTMNEDPRLGSVAPIVVDRDGDVRPGSAGGVLTQGPAVRMLEWLPPQSVKPDRMVGLDRLDYVPSRGTLVRSVAWDSVGGMDAQYYPVLWSDVDFCTALRAAGWRFALAAHALTQHDESGSTPRPYGEFLFNRNNDRFARKWGDDLASPRERSAPDPAIPPALVGDIAMAASGALGDLAVTYTRTRAESDGWRDEFERVEREVDALRRSRSWRLTAPLRGLAAFLRRRPGSAVPPR